MSCSNVDRAKDSLARKGSVVARERVSMSVSSKNKDSDLFREIGTLRSAKGVGRRPPHSQFGRSFVFLFPVGFGSAGDSGQG
jgi:hypothetical protein